MHAPVAGSAISHKRFSLGGMKAPSVGSGNQPLTQRLDSLARGNRAFDQHFRPARALVWDLDRGLFGCRS